MTCDFIGIYLQSENNTALLISFFCEPTGQVNLSNLTVGKERLEICSHQLLDKYNNILCQHGKNVLIHAL